MEAEIAGRGLSLFLASWGDWSFFSSRRWRWVAPGLARLEQERECLRTRPRAISCWSANAEDPSAIPGTAGTLVRQLLAPIPGRIGAFAPLGGIHLKP
jgi:hypothetical protein